eukprot:TRINITY_DN66026_c3_g1_i1.p1 TRINITY_DN66026_c3_g1~~TRINITY_DN66026_c3_g1_i1.p1  ORF type:complete len:148 (+),score=67.80 TRINITY_DN66026_c3_g1_i1:71-514(+)
MMDEVKEEEQTHPVACVTLEGKVTGQGGEQVDTHVAVTEFSNVVFVLVSQAGGKIGTMLHASRDVERINGQAAATGAADEDASPFTITTRLGRRDDMMATMFARRLIADLSKSSNKPLLLGLTLVKSCNNVKSLKEALNLVLDNKTW